MAKKILILCSSPRREGNTNTVARWVQDAAQQAGAEVELKDIAHLKYKSNGGTACMACQVSEKFECVIQDEATPILNSIADYDLVVAATPVYFFGPNAQLKILMDRMFSLVKFDADGTIRSANSNQRLALIATAGGGYENCLKPLEHCFQNICEFGGDKLESLLIPLAPQDPEELRKNDEIKKQALAFGKKLAAI
jgi:multimeric flavodoxin WrbA